MKRWFARVRCRLLAGHLPVTRSGGGTVRTVCYLCGGELGAGWDVRDLKRPVGLPDVQPLRVTRSQLKLRRSA